MPRYEFRCPEGHQFEVALSYGEFDKQRGKVKCACGQLSEQVFGPANLGSGLIHNQTHGSDRRGVARKRASRPRN